MSVTSFKDNVILWAVENDPAKDGPYDAVEAIFEDGDVDIIYQDPTECTIVPVGDNVGGNTTRGTSDGKKQAFVKQMSEVNITFPLRALAGAGEAPYYDAILRAGNFAPEVDAGSVIYKRKTVNQPAFTVYKFYRQLENDSWRLRIATGVRGGLTFNINNENEASATFTGNGQYFDIDVEREYFDLTTGHVALKRDGTAIVARVGGSVFQADQDPMTCSGMTVKVNDGSFENDDLIVSAMELNTAMEVTNISAVQGASTRRRGILTRAGDGATEGSMTLVEYTPALVDNVVAAVNNKTEHGLLVKLANGEGEIQFDAPKMQFMREAESDNGGVVSYDIPFRLNGDWTDNALADNELKITFSAVS